MHIICLTPIEKGVYNDNKSDSITTPPEGWAYIPEDLPLPSTFPRLGSLTAEEVKYTSGGKECSMMKVTAMTEGTLPPETPPQPSQLDIIEAQVTYTAMMTNTLLEV